MNEPYLLENICDSNSVNRKKPRKRKRRKKETRRNPREKPTQKEKETKQGTIRRANGERTLFQPGWDINSV
jgi:hypothetical protein